MIASANPIGMLTMPTFCSGKAGCAFTGTVQPGPMATSQMVTAGPPGHRREDCGEGHRSDERQEELAACGAEVLGAQELGQARCGEVAVRLAVCGYGGADFRLAHQCRCAEAKERGHYVKRPDQAHRP